MSENLLSRRIFTYDELVEVPPGNSPEQLVDVREYSPSITAKYNKLDMVPYTGEIILVRDAVAKRLASANDSLQQVSDFSLKIVYGYRHPEVQEKYFYKRRNELQQENPELSDDDLNRLTHNFVAMPDVAGHPAGAAVDLTVIDGAGEELDMGTGIADYANPEKIKTFSELADKKQMINRMLLHSAMVAQGFTPFYGEWWHFSWGDREWAAFNNKPAAIYGPIEL